MYISVSKLGTNQKGIEGKKGKRRGNEGGILQNGVGCGVEKVDVMLTYFLTIGTCVDEIYYTVMLTCTVICCTLRLGFPHPI